MTTRAYFMLFALVVICGCTTVSGDDGPPGSMGRTEYNVREPFTGNAPGRAFQNVQVIAPVAGARCFAGFMQEAPYTPREPVANERREVILHVAEHTRRLTIRCHGNGRSYSRTIEQVKSSFDPGAGVGAISFRSFPPIVHVPAPDAGAAARWEEWHQKSCATPHPSTRLCGEAYPLLRAADLGS